MSELIAKPVPGPLEDRAVNVPFYFKGYVTCIPDLYHDTAISSKQMDNDVKGETLFLLSFAKIAQIAASIEKPQQSCSS